jgi:hypothetical protein
LPETGPPDGPQTLEDDMRDPRRERDWGGRPHEAEPWERGYGPERGLERGAGPNHGYGYGGNGGRDDGRAFGHPSSVYEPGGMAGFGYGGSDARRGWPGGEFGSAQGAGRRGGEDRGFLERAGDEIASWMGDDAAARRRAEDDHRGKGPRGYRRSDARILEDVNDRLFDAPDVDASDVEVSVQDAEVTLTGKVDSRAARRAAEDCVERVSGVRHVQNNLRVREAGEATAPAL